MSKTVDTRTVEMRFDNKNFESNVKQSMSTLDKLKQKLKLDGASKGLEEVEKKSKKIEFKDLDRSIDNIGKKFSALETIATGVFLKIGMSAADAGMKIVKSFTVDQVSAGWDKYAEKTTAVQTIMANLKDDTSKFVDEASKMDYVNRYLEKLMWFSDETSYNFTDMTGNVGKFIANGQELEDSVTAMQGIATWAAMSGQNAQTASRAMYNIAQAMGVGSMKIKDWMSIENANMATAQFKELAITVGQKLGKIKKGQVTIENFRESLSSKGTKDWFDKDVMMEVFETYGEAANRIQEYAKSHKITSTEAIREIKKQDASFADSIGFKAFTAAQEAKTFGEVISATADAASTKWSNFFESIFGNYLEAKELWTNLSEDLYDIFVEPLNDLNDIVSIWKRGFKQGPLNSIDKAFDAGELDKIESGYRYISSSAAEAAVETSKVGDEVYYTIETLDDGTKEFVKHVKDASGAYHLFTKKIYDEDIELLSGRKLLIDGFKNIIDAVFLGSEEKVGKRVFEYRSILGALKEAFMEVFFPDLAAAEDGGKKSIAERIYELTKKFKEFTEKLKPLGNKLKNIFKGLFTAINILRKFIIAIIKPFKTVFSNLFGEVPDGILGFTDSISTWIQEFDKFLEENKVFEKVSEGVKAGIDAIAGALDWLSQTLTGLPLKELTGSIKNKVTEFFKNYDFKGHFENIGKFFSNIVEQIRQVETEDLPDKLTPLQNFWLGFKKIWEGIKKFFSLLSVPFKKIGEFVSNFFTGLTESIFNKDTEKKTSKLKPIWEGIKKVFQGIVGFFEKIGPALEKIGSWLGEKLSGIGDAIGEFAKDHDAKEIIEFILKGGLIASLTDFFFSLSSVFGGTGGILKSIKKDLDAVRGVLKAYQAEINASTILEVAMAIGILAGSFWVLAQIPSDKLKQAGEALAIIAGAVAGFSLLKDLLKVLTNLSNKTDTGKVLTGEGGPLAGIKNILTSVVSASIFANDATAKFVKICLGILLAALAILTVVKAMTKVATAFEALAAIPPEVIEKGGKVMAQVMVAFGAFAMLAGTANRASSALFAALGALILVFAIKKLVDVIAELGSDSEKMKNVRNAVDNFKDVFKAIAKMATIVVAIGLALAIIQTVIVAFASLGKQGSLGVAQVIKQFGKNFTRIALSLIVAAGAIAILAGVSKNVSPDSWSNIVSFMLLFVGIVGILQTVSVGLASFGKRSGKNTADLMKQFGKNFLRIAASMLIIAAAFAIFKLINLDAGTLLIVSAFFAIFLGIVSVLTWGAASIATEKKHLYFLENLKGIGKLFLKIAAALAIIAGAFAIFKLLNIDRGTIKLVSVIFAAFSVIVALFTYAAQANAIGEKGGAATAKSNAFIKNLKAIANVFVAMAGSLLIVAGAFAIMSLLHFNKHSMWEIAGLFAAFMAVASAIAFILGKFLKDNNLENTLYGLSAYVSALSVSMVIIAGAFAIMDSLKMDPTTMTNVAWIFAGLIIAFGAMAVAAGKFIDNDKLVKTLLGLSAYVLALSASLVIIAAAFKIMDSLKMDPTTITKVAWIFGLFIALVGGLAIGAAQLIKDGMAILGIAAVAGFLVVAAGALNLAALAVVNIANNVDPSKLETVIDIIGMLGLIAAVLGAIGIAAGASELGALGLAALAIQLVAFGAACLLAAEGVKILLGALAKDGEKAAKNIVLISASMKQALKDFGDSFGNIMLVILALFLLGPASAVAAAGLLFLAIPVSIIALVLTALVKAVDIFIESFTNLVEIVGSKGSEFVSNVSSVTNALLDTIIETGPKLSSAIYTVITALVDGLTSAVANNIGKIFATITLVIVTISAALSENSYMISFSIVKIFLETIIGILDALALLIGPAITALVNFISELADAIERNLDPMIEAGKKLGNAIWEGIKTVLFPKKLVWEDGGFKFVDRSAGRTGATSAVESILGKTSRSSHHGGSSSGYSGKFGNNITGEKNSILSTLFGGLKDSFGISGKTDGTSYIEGFLGSLKSGASDFNFGEVLGIGDLSGSLGSLSLFGSGTKKKDLFQEQYEAGLYDDINSKYKYVSKSAAEAAVETSKAGDDVYYTIEALDDGSEKFVYHIKEASGAYHNYSKKIYAEKSSMESVIGMFADGKGMIDDFGSSFKDAYGLLNGGTSGNSSLSPISGTSNPAADIINLLFKNKGRGSLDGTSKLASSAAYDVAPKETSIDNSQQITNSGNTTVNNTFNVTAADPESFANKVSVIIQRQVNRKQAVWDRVR